MSELNHTFEHMDLIEACGRPLSCPSPDLSVIVLTCEQCRWYGGDFPTLAFSLISKSGRGYVCISISRQLVLD